MSCLTWVLGVELMALIEQHVDGILIIFFKKKLILLFLLGVYVCAVAGVGVLCV